MVGLAIACIQKVTTNLIYEWHLGGTQFTQFILKQMREGPLYLVWHIMATDNQVPL